MQRSLLVVVLLGWCLLLLTSQRGGTQASSCQLSITGSGTSTVFVEASGCSGDTIALLAGAEGNQKQFPLAQGPDVYLPFNLSQCDLDVRQDHGVALTYTAVVVSGPDKGMKSSSYSGTLDPDPPSPEDLPPTVSLDGNPSPGAFVRPDDAITLSVTASDDVGLVAVKVTGPSGEPLLNERITPARTPKGQSPCHQRSTGQTETLQVPKPFVVPSDPPRPVIRFTALAIDTAGHKTPNTVEYLTEATWSGRLLLAGTGGVPGNICTTKWRIDLWVKTSAANEVSGTAQARHDPLGGCRWVGRPDNANSVIIFTINGTYDGKKFQLFFRATDIRGGEIAWGIGGLHLLMLPTPLTVELTQYPGDRDLARGTVARNNAGNVEGRDATASIAGDAMLQCCFPDSVPAPLEGPQKTPPIFLGEDQ